MLRRIMPILITLLAVTLLIVFIPWIDGYLLKHHLLETVSILNKNSDESKVTIHVMNYEEGWLSSHVMLQLRPVAPADNTLNVYLIIESTMTHGPLIHDPREGWKFAYAKFSNQLRLPSESAAILSKNAQGGVIQANSIAKFDGSWENKFTLREAAQIIPLIGKVMMSNVNGKIDFAVKMHELQQFQFNMDIGSISLQTDPAYPNPFVSQISMQSVTYESQAVRQTNGLWQTETSIIMPILSIKKLSGAVIQLKNLNFRTLQISNSNTEYSVNANLNLNELKISDHVVNMVSPATVNITLNNLNIGGVKELSKFLKSARQVVVDLDAEQLLRAYFSLIAPMINPMTSVSEVIVINTSLGRLKSDAKVS